MAAIRTKICGITRTQDAEFACEAGADAIGLNFYTKSKRFVDTINAAEIAKAVHDRVAVFGVFVNSTIAEIRSICEAVELSHVQFHGDETVVVVAEAKSLLPEKKLVRAVRVSKDDFDSAQKEIDLWQNAGVDMILLDAASLEGFGGTGKQLPWHLLDQLTLSVPWLLAGGLDPENVATAIANSKPDGVDVASGVELAPGIKDANLVRSFLRNSNSEFSNIEG